MAVSVELIGSARSRAAKTMLEALFEAIGETDSVLETEAYKGGSEWLCLYGVGESPRSEWRDAHIANGGHVLLWDLGYSRKDQGYLRVSIDTDHPQKWLDRTSPDPARWESLKIELRGDYQCGGHIVVAGLGQKSRDYHGAYNWEEKTLVELRERFPGYPIVLRPKPKRTNPVAPIEDVLRRAGLVVVRHSNVAIDAIIAGVPFEAEDGAAVWLNGKVFSEANRIDFLRRLAWWQWKPSEAREAWSFLKGMV